MLHQFQLSLQRRIEMVLNMVVCAPREKLSDFWPPIPELLVRLNHKVIFGLCPFVLLYVRVQVIVPSTKMFIWWIGMYLSLHCLPMRPGSDCAICDQFCAPYLSTIVINIWSSSSVHGPFTIAGLRTFCHLWRHCTSVLLSKNEAILFQFFAYNQQLRNGSFIPHTDLPNASIYHPKQS